MTPSSFPMPALRDSLGKMLLLAGGLIGAALVLGMLPVTARLHDMPAGHPADALGLVALGAIACAVGVPRQVVAFAAGYGWGLIPAILLALAAQLVGCATDLFWARVVGRDFTRRWLGGRLARLDGVLSRRPFAATLALRLLPVGNNLVLNLLAGLSSLPAAAFLAASAIGYLPQTVIFVLMGRGSQLGHTTELAISVALLVASTLCALLIFRTGVLTDSAPADGAAGSSALSSGPQTRSPDATMRPE